MATHQQTLDRIRKDLNNRNNQHDLIVLTEAEVAGIWLDRLTQTGTIPRQQADTLFQCAQDDATPEQKAIWKKFLETTLGNTGSIDSAVIAARVVKDFSGGGTYVTKTYAGKTYFIFKGNQRLRAIITGTRYLANNPKIVSMGIGHLGVKQAAISGARLTVFAMAGYRVLEFLLTDRVTLTRLIGNLATDVVKIGAAAGVSYAFGAFAVAMGMTVVAGPLVVAIAVGVGASWGLEWLDNHYGITDKLVAQMDLALEQANKNLQRTRQNIQQSLVDRASRVADTVIDELVNFLVSSAKRSAKQFIRREIYPSINQLPSFRWLRR